MWYLLKLFLEKYDLRCEIDITGTGEISFCEHRNINICCSSISINIHISCSFIIKQFKLNLKNVNNIINIYQSDKCANECPDFDTNHWNKPVRVQISLQPLEAGKISWSHDFHPCMWHSYSGTDIQRKMPVWPPLSINEYVHYQIFVQLLLVQWQAQIEQWDRCVHNKETPATDILKLSQFLCIFCFCMSKWHHFSQILNFQWCKTVGANFVHSDFPYFLKRNQGYSTKLIWLFSKAIHHINPLKYVKM